MAICVHSLLAARAAEGPVTPSFEEVSNLVRSNLVGASEQDLDRLAVEGFLKELYPRVVLLGDGQATGEHDAAGVLESAVYRDSVAYLRLGRIVEGTGEQLHRRYEQLASSNRLSGLVLDLRMATGEDYAAALAIADLFLVDEVPLMNWGEGLKHSVAKSDAITLPLAVLVNARTGGNAEALAAVMRETGVALLIGTRTEGTAGIRRTFPLAEGGSLRITVSAVQLANAQRLTMDGLGPDVSVNVTLDEEEKLLSLETSEDAADTPVVDSLTNTAARGRMNEAELVRHWRGERINPEDFEPASPSLQRESSDRSLVRALDLMEGLAILRSWER